MRRFLLSSPLLLLLLRRLLQRGPAMAAPAAAARPRSLRIGSPPRPARPSPAQPPRRPAPRRRLPPLPSSPRPGPGPLLPARLGLAAAPGAAVPLPRLLLAAPRCHRHVTAPPRAPAAGPQGAPQRRSAAAQWAGPPRGRGRCPPARGPVRVPALRTCAVAPGRGRWSVLSFIHPSSAPWMEICGSPFYREGRGRSDVLKAGSRSTPERQQLRRPAPRLPSPPASTTASVSLFAPICSAFSQWWTRC